MKPEPLVSVIVAVTENEETLYRCIECIMDQSYRNIEIILILVDRSDRVLDICNNLALIDSRIKIIKSKSITGSNDEMLMHAYREGLSHAGGSFVTFADSNDKVHRDLIRTLLRVTIKYQCQVTCCKIQRDNIKTYNRSKKIKVAVYRRNAAFMSRRFTNELKGKLFDISLFKDISLESYGLFHLYYKASRLSVIDREMYYEHDRGGIVDNKSQIRLCFMHYKERIQFFKDKEKKLLELAHEYYGTFLAGYYIYRYRNGSDTDSLNRILTSFKREYSLIKSNSITPGSLKFQLGLLRHYPGLYVSLRKLFRINASSYMFKNLNRL